TLQCGRQGDALKLYLSWLYYGKNGLGQRVDHALDIAQALVKKITCDKFRSQFVLVHSNYANVCFWYVPSTLRPRFDKELGDDFFKTMRNNETIKNSLDQTTLNIYQKIGEQAKVCIDIAPLPNAGLPHFFRVACGNYRLKESQLDDILNHIIEAAKSCRCE
ncbi:hypothetical protein RFI_07609, partial [Reticulomyxa filosa]